MSFIAGGCMSEFGNSMPPVEPSATQPEAPDLLDDRGFARELSELQASPRVRLETIARSHEGRPVTLIIVGMPEAMAEMEQHARVTAEPELLASGARLPVLFTGDSWGHEASQVEGLLKAARTLAFDDSEEVSQALSKTLALFIPLINPDGRAAALREWRQTPLSNGDTGAGNAFGFYLNRDFIHGTQPEGRGVIETVMRWRPAAVVDLHEDMFNLGTRLEAVCFVEPFAKGFDVEEHPMTRAAIVDLGKAIAGRWRQHGFKTAFDEEGDNSFAPLPEPGKGLNPVASSAGRLPLLATLHGIPGFITESARTPGSQTWQARVQQKSDAALATLEEVSAQPENFLNAVYNRRLAEVAEASDRFVVISEHDQSHDGLVSLLDLLQLHGVEVHRVASPSPAFVVRLAQPESRIAQHLLLGEQSKLNEAPPALGVRVLSSDSLSESDRRAYIEAPVEPPVLSPAVPPEDGDAYVASPTVRSTALVNQLLTAGAARVSVQKNRFHFSGGGPAIRWAAARLGVPLEVAPPASVAGEAREAALRLPRVALYAGQGIPHYESAEIAWALEQGSFPYRRFEASDFARADCLADVEVLIVPNGSASEIANGWNPEAPNRKAPWEMHQPAAGVGQPGLDAIRGFVEAGGTYVGLGGGGALLAGADHLRIAQAEMVPAEVGLGQVRLKIVRPNSPLLVGYRTDQPLPAFFTAPPGSPKGGYAFRSAEDAVANYDGVRALEEELSFVRTEPLSADAGNAAIVHQRLGSGHVVLFGIAPAFRAQWRSTFGLLYNALYLRSEA